MSLVISNTDRHREDFVRLRSGLSFSVAVANVVAVPPLTMSRKRPASTAPDIEEDDAFSAILSLIKKLLAEKELLAQHADHVHDCLATIDAMQRR